MHLFTTTYLIGSYFLRARERKTEGVDILSTYYASFRYSEGSSSACYFSGSFSEESVVDQNYYNSAQNDSTQKYELKK